MLRITERGKKNKRGEIIKIINLRNRMRYITLDLVEM